MDYQLLDAGDGRKLERVGPYTLIRPCTEALWKPRLKPERWADADAEFRREGKKSGWVARTKLPEQWPLRFGELTMLIRPTDFGHLGLFPEQLASWDWITERLRKTRRECSVLSLFAYTGAGTLACAKAGARLCHVDASKGIVEWARENARESGLENAPIRWIVDDVKKFLRREVKRGHRYDGIILDPPTFGRGSKGEVWKIERDLVPLLELCLEVLSERPLFVAMHGYTLGMSTQTYRNLMEDALEGLPGSIHHGELTSIPEHGLRPLPHCAVVRYDGLKE